jgi:hypothetical protein
MLNIKFGALAASRSGSGSTKIMPFLATQAPAPEKLILMNACSFMNCSNECYFIHELH